VGALLAIASAGVAAEPAATPESRYFTVQAQTVSLQTKAYGRVRPIALVPVKAPAAGIVANFSSLPGATVRSGEVVATLSGPEVATAVARAQAALTSATAKRGAAQKTLTVLRSELASHLSTAQQVAQAEADLADAIGAIATAKAELETATQTATIRSPVAGTIVGLNAAAGERVSAGDTLITIQPSDQLWVTAQVYGANATTVHSGQRATFQGRGGAVIPVQVVSIAPTSSGSGDVTVGLRASRPNPDWRSGEYGNVVFEGADARFVAVPTSALILDQGKWWVLVHSAEGDKPVEVVPGLSRGWRTFVRSGLAAGTQIVAQNAYLEFHRGIASRYQPPD
jgi:RND family efflux transporter MFP subunit